MAGDDHDFLEANHAAWLAADGTLRQVTLRDRPADAPLTPMYRERLGDEVEALLAGLEADLPPSDFREEVLDWLRRHYRPEATVAGSFGTALAEFLAPHGVLCLDSTHSSLKAAAAPLLVRAIEEAPRLNAVLSARADELTADGRDPGVAVTPDATLVMVEGTAGRDRLMIDGDGWRTRRGGEAFTRDGLRTIAEE